jgi:hypothetical protein
VIASAASVAAVEVRVTIDDDGGSDDIDDDYDRDDDANERDEARVLTARGQGVRSGAK